MPKLKPKLPPTAKPSKKLEKTTSVAVKSKSIVYNDEEEVGQIKRMLTETNEEFGKEFDEFKSLKCTIMAIRDGFKECGIKMNEDMVLKLNEQIEDLEMD